MRKPRALLLVALAAVCLARPARAADLPTLAQYLGFIEGFQYVLEYCRAEANLPDDQVGTAWKHIADRRGLIFAGLNEQDRQRIVTDAEPMKKKMLDGFLAYLAKSQPGQSLPELCRVSGFFTGVMESELKQDDKETAAIKKAKS